MGKQWNQECAERLRVTSGGVQGLQLEREERVANHASIGEA